MVKFEYRRYDDSFTFPVLYVYERMSETEAAMRFACDYFVKEGVVYEKASAAAEPGCYVVYVKESAEEYPLNWRGNAAGRSGGVKIEMRQFSEGVEDSPLIKEHSFFNDMEALLHLKADYWTVDGIEWSRSSAEIDEDREVYVYYAVPSNE